MNIRWISLIAIVHFSVAAFANDQEQFANLQSFSVRPDRAYLLVRTSERGCGFLCGSFLYTPIFIRTLNDDELNRATTLARQDSAHWLDQVESNIVEPLPDKIYAEQGTEKTFLISVKPGTYILGGLARTKSGPGEVTTCLCMGTVQFEAKSGLITDVGYILNARDDQATAIPELSGWVTGTYMGDGMFPEAVAVRPVTSTYGVPISLKDIPVSAANYRAVRPFPNYLGAPLMRLAPLNGVLDYDKDGEVIDLKFAGRTGDRLERSGHD